jgi:probable HAF family extracellular repeat protein
MKLHGVGVVAAVAVLAGTLSGSGIAGTLTGAGPHSPRAGQGSYHITELPSLGGTSSTADSINDRGWVSGYSSLTGNASIHATLWRDGKITDLGTLGGPNSAVLWPVKDDGGIVTGISQTSRPDTHRGEPFSCSVFLPAATATGYQCSGFEWRDNKMRALPTLGGPNGFATGANDMGEVVGWAQDATHDSTCDQRSMLQFRAVVWGPGPGQIRQLPPLPGDTVSAATAINDRGQAVGISGYCDQAVGRFSAIHAVLWQHGRATSIGTLGGVAWNTPMAINERGDVVGFGNTSARYGGRYHAQAFLWTPGGGIRKLGVLPGDATSQALGINDRGQVVGESCTAQGSCQAFIYQDSTMMPVSAQPGFQGTLVTANDINDSGVITGQAQLPDGSLVAFVGHPAR